VNNENSNSYSINNREFVAERVFTPYNIIKRVILPYWPVYILTFIGAYFLGKYQLSKESYVYEVYGKVLIKPELSSGKGQQVLEDLDMFASTKVVDNELEIIKSRMLSAEVAKSINSYVRYYTPTERKYIELDWDFPIQFEAINEDSLRGTGSEVTIIIGSRKQNMRIDGKVYAIKDQTIKLRDEYYRVTILPESLNKINPGLYKFRISSLEEEIQRLVSGVIPAPTGKGTTIIGIRFSGLNIRNCHRVVNEYINQYTNSGVEDKRRVAQYTISFIEERLRLVSGELDSVESNIENFKKKTGVIDVGSQSSLYMNKVINFDVELNKVNLRLDLLKSIESYLLNNRNNPGLAPSLMDVADPLLSTLLVRLYDLEFNYNRQKKISGVLNENLINLTEEIKEVKKSIFENINGIRENLVINKRQIERQLDQSKGELMMFPSKERELIDISRQQAVKNEIFSYLLEKREESAISFASTVSDVRVIERAYGSTTLSPKPHLTYGLNFSLAVFLPLMFFFWRVMLNPKIQFRDEIEEMLNLPLLGELMFDEKKRGVIMNHNERGHLAESLRSLRTKLTYFKTQSNHQVLMISSSLPGEGKSFISVNLGLSYSLINNKVVLVGGDLRKPTLHKMFNMSMKKGLSSYLNNSSKLDEVVYATEYDNLYILPSGAIPPNPSELLEGTRMTTLVEELKQKFDIVIFDTPPLGLVSDAEIIARHCDVHMFVVRYNYTPKEVVENVLEKAKATGLFRQFSVIFNGIKPKGLGKYGYSYGNYYAYGYNGYGYYGSTKNRNRFGIRYLFKKIIK
jgi:tyrosine-protein kinase Etk/Wzc